MTRASVVALVAATLMSKGLTHGPERRARALDEAESLVKDAEDRAQRAHLEWRERTRARPMPQDP